MKNGAIITFAFLFLSFNIHAQKGSDIFKISGGAEIPVGFFASGFETGWGIYVTDYYGINDNGSILLSTGLAYWKDKGLSLTRAGYRRILAPSGFYLQAEAGIAVYLQNFGEGTTFSIGGGPGYLVKTGPSSAIDIYGRINHINNRNFISLGAGYQFKL